MKLHQRVAAIIIYQLHLRSSLTSPRYSEQANSLRPITAGSVPGSVQDVKIAKLSNSTFALVFDGQANPDGSLYNSAAATTPLSSARAYTALFVRHWDTCSSHGEYRAYTELICHRYHSTAKQYLVYNHITSKSSGFAGQLHHECCSQCSQGHGTGISHPSVRFHRQVRYFRRSLG